ncbi:hypothetical protein GCM10009864_71150 [Streptomyces lunalinharesii]|uniref:Uncharacterized protein n=1 Tax=Streptomyces lunalinharesii TaxID=333384 RepID=A0ABN3SWN5_9ACTN
MAPVATRDTSGLPRHDRWGDRHRSRPSVGPGGQGWSGWRPRAQRAIAGVLGGGEEKHRQEASRHDHRGDRNGRGLPGGAARPVARVTAHRCLLEPVWSVCGTYRGGADVP